MSRALPSAAGGRRFARAFGAVACAGAALTAPAPAAAAHGHPGPTIKATPGLFPAFRPGVPDYVVRCRAGAPVRFAVATPPATRVAIGARRPRGGSFAARVALVPRMSVALSVTSGGRTRTYHVRCLPRDFPTWNFSRSGRPQARYYLVTPSVDRPNPGYVVVFDDNGVPLWWMKGGPPPFDAHLLPDGDLAWTRWQGHQPASGFYEEHALDGSLVKRFSTVGYYTNHHELRVLPDGSYLLITYLPRDGVDLSRWHGPRRATVLDGEIQRFDPAGNLVWSWSTKDHVATAETGRWLRTEIVDTKPIVLPDGRPSYDLVHMNSLEPVSGHRLVFSARHLDAVYEIDTDSGQILWKLGGTRTSKSLRIVGDRYAAKDFGGQHDARVADDGRTLTLFDNGTHLRRLPRALEFRLDVAHRTATVVRELRFPRAGRSKCCGSARRLAGGDWVVSWGDTEYVTEQTPAGRPVLTLRFRGGRSSYRAEPVLPGGLDRAALRSGMDARAR